MNYFRLRKMREDLSLKSNKTKEEEELLKELQSLGKILDSMGFSLATSSTVCPACGKSLT